MAKFKIGDQVRVVEVDDSHGQWSDWSVGKIGTVEEDDTMPWVIFHDGDKDWGDEKYLELVEPRESTVSAELTHITIGGKRFRLVAED